MSSGFNVIRRHSLDATGVRIKELTQELARQRSESSSSTLETDDVRSMGRMDHSTIKLNDESLKFMTLLGSPDVTFEMPTEPDFNYLKVWFMLDHLGSRMRDMSGFGNDAHIAGHPTLRRAGLDLGFMQTSASPATPVMLFNSGFDVVSSTNGEYIWIQDNNSIKFSLFSAGFSIAFRFRCLDFSAHNPPTGGTYIRRLAAKTDDAANGWNICVNTPGTVEFQILHNGVNYQQKTTGYSTASWYQIVITYNPQAGSTADQRIKMYTAGTESSVSSTTNIIIPAYTNLRIGARDSVSGFFRGYIHDFRMYMGKVLTQQEITNLNTNEITIDNIEKGHLFILQYATIGVASPRRQKKHKYNMNGRVTRTHTHKYTINGRLTASTTKRHKFNLLNKITKSKTHKYNVTGLLQAMTTQYIRFAKSTGANGVTQEVTFNSTPQALIVWSDGTTSNNTFNENYHLYYGFSDGTNHACVSGYGQDAVSTTNAFSGLKSDKVISMMNTTLGTVSAEASVAFGANKATFTWSTNDARAVYVHCLAIWGLTAAEVKTFTTGTTSTGNRAYSLTNSSLVPNFIHTITQGGPVAWNTGYGNAISFGAATSPSKQWSVGNTILDAVSISSNYYNWSYSDTTNLLAMLDDDSLTVEATAELYSMSAGQFTLNWTDAPVATTRAFSVLCLDGDNIDVGTFAEPGATGSQNVTVDPSVDTVKGLMVFTTDRTADAGDYNAYMSIGGASGTGATEQGAVSASDQDGTSSTTTARINKTGSVVRMVDPEATATSSTTPAEASVTALGTPDQFTVNWSARNSTRRNHYIVFGQTTGGGTSPLSLTITMKYNITGQIIEQSTHKYSIEGKVSTTKTHKYNIEVTQGYTEVYNVSTGTISVSLYSGSAYIRAGIYISSSSSPMWSQTPKRVTVALSKYGSPTGTIYVRIRKSSDDSIGGEIGTMSAADVSTALTNYTFTNNNQSYAMVAGDRISVEFSGGDSSDYISTMRTTSDVLSYNSLTRYNGSSWVDNGTYDFRAIVYV